MNNKSSIRQVKKLIDLKLSEKNKVPLVVAVTGNGGVGKSHLCSYLNAEYSNSFIFNLDKYYYPAELRHKKGITGAHPNSFDGEKLLNDFRSIPPDKKIIFVDGLSALLVDDWKNIYDVVIFIEANADVIFKRQLYRVKNKNKYNKNEFKNIFDLRKKQFEEFIAVQKNCADLVIKTKFNRKQ